MTLYNYTLHSTGFTVGIFSKCTENVNITFYTQYLDKYEFGILLTAYFGDYDLCGDLWVRGGY